MGIYEKDKKPLSHSNYCFTFKHTINIFYTVTISNVIYNEMFN